MSNRRRTTTILHKYAGHVRSRAQDPKSRRVVCRAAATRFRPELYYQANLNRIIGKYSTLDRVQKRIRCIVPLAFLCQSTLRRRKVLASASSLSLPTALFAQLTDHWTSRSPTHVTAGARKEEAETYRLRRARHRVCGSAGRRLRSIRAAGWQEVLISIVEFCRPVN